jgi:hypothetical protein
VLDLVEELAADGPAIVAHGRFWVLPTWLFSQQVGILVSVAPGQHGIAIGFASLHGAEQVTDGKLRPAAHLVVPENPRQGSLHAPDQTVSGFVRAGTIQYSVAENTPPLVPAVSKVKGFIFSHCRTTFGSPHGVLQSKAIICHQTPNVKVFGFCEKNRVVSLIR